LERDGIRSKRGLRGVEEGAAHSEGQGRRGKSVPREGTLLFRERGREIQGETKGDRWVESKTKDLTWGYKTPQGQLYILTISQIPTKGCIV